MTKSTDCCNGTGIDLDDAEYTWPPGDLPPATGPALVAMRMTSIEARLANLERGNGELERHVADLSETAQVAIDALTYMAGAVERVRVLLRQRGDGNAQ